MQLVDLNRTLVLFYNDTVTRLGYSGLARTSVASTFFKHHNKNMGEDEDVVNIPVTQVSSADTSHPPNDNRARGRCNNCRNFNQPGSTSAGPKTIKSQGRCDELKGHVNDCSNPGQAADEFTRTTNDIAEHTGIKYGAEVKITIETLRKPILPPPADPSEVGKVTEKWI